MNKKFLKALMAAIGLTVAQAFAEHFIKKQLRRSDRPRQEDECTKEN